MVSQRALCFVDMPFGKKTDLASGTEIDFDRIYAAGIRPAIESVGLEALRGDEERSGGIIHGAMFARLLLAEVVVADLTLANPNVFYELGIRHAAKPFTTVPIFANVHALPFDVGLVRSIPYELANGVMTDASAAALRETLAKRLKEALAAASTDSPIFQLLPKFPGIELDTKAIDSFRDRLRREDEFRSLLDRARSHSTNEERRDALLSIEQGLGDLAVVPRGVLVDLMLSYRSIEAWSEMIALADTMPEHLRAALIVQQQLALALNRRNQPRDRERAIRILTALVAERGPDPETLGILGRIHKDRYREAKGGIFAEPALDDAINAYARGFEADPRDYYPGVNAITLLITKGTPEAMKEADRLVPIVAYAVARRGGATSNDYWDLATTLELACISRDWSLANRVLPRVIAYATEGWMLKTTLANLELLRDVRSRNGEVHATQDDILTHLRRASQGS